MQCFEIDFREYSAGAGASLGGEPLLPAGAEWPLCKTCSQPMQFFLQFPIDAAWNTRLEPGSQLSLFMCLQHCDPPMPPLSPAIEGQLPAEYWQGLGADAEYCQYFLQLTPPQAELAPQASRPGLAAQGLSFAAGEDDVNSEGRWPTGKNSFKIGGTPSWIQNPESYTCCCGAPMDYLFQVPEYQEFATGEGAPKQPNSIGGNYLLFLGNETYVTACRAQCHPRALWPICHG